MQNTNSNKGKYVLAALLGAAAGGATVALSTRAVPKMMSEMEAKCKRMMAGMQEGSVCAGDMCQRRMAGMEQNSEQATCESGGGACHGNH